MSDAKPALAACEYKTGKTLGQGSYGVVKEGIKISTGEKYAIKVISKKLMRGREGIVMNEINVLKKVSKGHKNIVTLVDYFESPNNLMDLCTGGELFDRIVEKGHFYEADVMKIITTVLEAIQYLHELNIIHRDVKPENLIFRSSEPDSDLMIADFGLSRIVQSDDDHTRTTCGTPGYMAPEILEKKGHNKSVDLWSSGVMTYFLYSKLTRLCGYMPFESKNNLEELDNIIQCRFSFGGPHWKEVSQNAKDFISGLLVLDPKKRMTAHQALEHPWLDPTGSRSKKDLLPIVQEGFNARKVFKKAVGLVKTVNKLSNPNLFKESRSTSNSNDSLANGVFQKISSVDNLKV